MPDKDFFGSDDGFGDRAAVPSPPGHGKRMPESLRIVCKLPVNGDHSPPADQPSCAAIAAPTASIVPMPSTSVTLPCAL